MKAANFILCFMYIGLLFLDFLSTYHPVHWFSNSTTFNLPGNPSIKFLIWVVFFNTGISNCVFFQICHVIFYSFQFPSKIFKPFNSLNIISISILSQCLIIPVSEDLLLLPVLSSGSCLQCHLHICLVLFDYVLDTILEKLFIWDGLFTLIHSYSLGVPLKIFFLPKQ